MLRVKGVILESTLRENRRLPPAGREPVVRAQDPALLPLLYAPLDPGAWVPAASLTGLMAAYAAAKTGEPEGTYRQLGRQTCDETLTTVYRLMSRLARPEFVLRRAVRVWGDFYDRGEFEVLETLPESGAVRVTGAEFPHPALCHRIGGWIERAVELSGGREVVVEHTVCTFDRGECEEWRARWRL
jgi:hypothetical protein